MTIEEMRALTDVPVVVVNKHGNIKSINDEFEKVFGFSEQEALGESICIIIPDNLHDAHNMGFSRFISTEESKIMGQSLSLKARNKNGDEFDAEHYIIGEKNADDWDIAATIKPL